MKKLRATVLAFSLVTVLSAVACGSSGGLTRPTPTPNPTSVNPAELGSAADRGASPAVAAAKGTVTSPTTAPGGETIVEPTTGPEAPESAQEQEAIDIMWRYGALDEGAVIVAGRNGHPGLVPVLVESARLTLNPSVALTIARALERITGVSVGGDFVLSAPWYSWMSRQDPPQVELDGFDEWKGQRLGGIDPSFTKFLYQDVPARIPIWSVQWGGVLRDGIPPLEFPKTFPGDEVNFLLPDEPVFGVTINGESRAYPHRIMGWHELVNDLLGGEQITFVF